MSHKVIVCSLSSGPEKITRRTKYDDVKAAVVKAGRYSVFEATANEFAAAIFTCIDRDPELITKRIAYPWIGVAEKPK